MRLNVSLILAFLLPCIVYSAGSEEAFDSDDANTNPMARVAGGWDSRNRYTASIQLRVQPTKLKHICGAAFINDLYVVTAAHCVKNKKKWKIRVVGCVNRLAQVQKDENIFNIKKIIIHENYTKINGETPDSDIALLQLQKKVEFAKIMRPVTLPEPLSPPDQKTTVLTGWGKLDENDEDLPARLQKAYLQTVPQDQCRTKYDNIGLQITDNMLCAAFQHAGPCQTDEGGPLMLRGKLVGITSWYHGCGTQDYPGVFVQVGRFVDWINAEIS